ncbi:hypothetical protein ACQ4M3_01020 [Leptolyngbya sp. AN03gr2]|uniref:hypothetical protein n=1 Tax=unclassified Leptolyngbya TaxID=2650499 RepID=UPI003D32313D
MGSSANCRLEQLQSVRSDSLSTQQSSGVRGRVALLQVSRLLRRRSLQSLTQTFSFRYLGRWCAASLHPSELIHMSEHFVERSDRRCVIPCYVDFCLDELILLKRGSVCGYQILSPAESKALPTARRSHRARNGTLE